LTHQLINLFTFFFSLFLSFLNSGWNGTHSEAELICAPKRANHLTFAKITSEWLQRKQMANYLSVVQTLSSLNVDHTCNR